jgi:hypothetical protein
MSDRDTGPDLKHGAVTLLHHANVFMCDARPTGGGNRQAGSVSMTRRISGNDDRDDCLPLSGPAALKFSRLSMYILSVGDSHCS